MALSLFPFPLPPLSTSSSLRSSRKTHFIIVSCSQQHTIEVNKKKRKPKPSFSDKIRDKWSTKPPIQITKLPWENQQWDQNHLQSEFFQEEEEEVEGEGEGSSGYTVTESESGTNSVSSVPLTRVNFPPWDHGSALKRSQFDDVVNENLDNFEIDNNVSIGFDREIEANFVGDLGKNVEFGSKFDGGFEGFVENDETSIGLREEREKMPDKGVAASSIVKSNKIGSNINRKSEGSVKTDENPIGLFLERAKSSFEGVGSSPFYGTSEKARLPWEKGRDESKRSTMLAEKLIPENELKRLRNVALRMVERMKVGPAGVTQQLVEAIHERWKEDEVVKLKFEGSPKLHMRRTHELLESRTGGLVIWRSGGSIVLYRGMSYHLPCVQSYKKENLHNKANTHPSTTIEDDVNRMVGFNATVGNTESSISTSTRYLRDLSKDEITDLSELDNLLEDLGPRFKDWSGCEPVPVDADMLPSMIPGFKRPFRLLPYGMRQTLRDRETTFYRRTARTMPPQFALGRNRELQGLAMAMAKLWERSAIAKIAIKRCVENTCNERMAEELKILTGGTLLSRNKEFIVFYRGNDFLPPAVAHTLEEAHKLSLLKEDEEEQARRHASTLILSNRKSSKVPLVAGTLAETMAATSHWGNQPSSEDIERMRRETALARHASMVRFLEDKLALAKEKVKKAEKALEKVQESLAPAELPTDLETLGDEERFLFRKIGLSMKPYLLLGRRGMFDGTIENIHLHWKYREVVKLIVDRKCYAQVKQIAISLEAESGGVLVSVDKTMKGHAIILYRGKNYQRPNLTRPNNLLTKRQALARSIELQRREALKHHISSLMERIETMKAELENMMSVEEIDEETFYSRMDDASSSDEMEEDEDEGLYLDDSGKEEVDL